MNEKLKQLYQEIILQHNRHPVHFEKRENPHALLDAYNPICGDRFQLYVDVADGKITRLSFHGYGCAISKAATSVLVSHLEGHTIAKASQVVQKFLHALASADDFLPLQGELAAFLPARQFPERMNCVTLSWEAMNTFLQDHEHPLPGSGLPTQPLL